MADNTDSGNCLEVSHLAAPTGSHILALATRRIRRDWPRRYNTLPVLIETSVETPLFTGGVYRVSGWVRVGTTR